jgi:hypothetical protein
VLWADEKVDSMVDKTAEMLVSMWVVMTVDKTAEW